MASNAEKEEVRNLVLSCRNLPGVDVSTVNDLNTLVLLRRRSLVLTGPAFDEIQTAEETTRPLKRDATPTEPDAGPSAPFVHSEGESPEGGSAEGESAEGEDE